jgi:UDP-2,3-diacylglucosamine pyrophosphatase LpxH
MAFPETAMQQSAMELRSVYRCRNCSNQYRSAAQQILQMNQADQSDAIAANNRYNVDTVIAHHHHRGMAVDIHIDAQWLFGHDIFCGLVLHSAVMPTQITIGYQTQ